MYTLRIIVIFIGCTLLGCQTNNGQSITVIDKEVIKEKVIGKKVQLIDVRTPEEYDLGHIGDALNFNVINGDTFLIQIQSLNKKLPVYLYCKVGGRSGRAAKLLKKQGFKKIFDYAGGYNDWITE